MPVDEGVCNVIHAFLCVEDVHGGKMAVFWLDAYHLLGHLDGVRVFGV